MMESIAPHGMLHHTRRSGLRQATVLYEGFHTHCHATLPAQDAIPPCEGLLVLAMLDV
jgi:hypothetical protein